MSEFTIPATGIEVSETGAMAFDGPEAVNVFRWMMIRRMLKMEIETGMRASRFPIVPQIQAEGITTKRNKRAAYADLDAWMVAGGAESLPLR